MYWYKQALSEIPGLRSRWEVSCRDPSLRYLCPQPFPNLETPFYPSAVPTRLFTGSHGDSRLRTDLPKALEENQALSQLISQHSLVKQVVGEGWEHLNCFCAEKIVPASDGLGFHRVVKNIFKGSPNSVLASAELVGRDLGR